MSAWVGLGPGVATVADLLPRFDSERLPWEPWHFDAMGQVPAHSR